MVLLGKVGFERIIKIWFRRTGVHFVILLTTSQYCYFEGPRCLQFCKDTQRLRFLQQVCIFYILKLHFKTIVQGKFVHYSFKERNRKTCHLEQTHKIQTANPKPGSEGVRGHKNTNWWGCLVTKKSKCGGPSK